MSKMNESVAAVKLFDVVGVDSRGYVRLAVGDSLSLESAVARSAGYNAGAGRLVATVMPSVSFAT